MKLLTIANMYPSAKDPTYGTFVRTTADGLQSLDNEDRHGKVVISGRRYSKVAKIAAYAKFYTIATWKLLFGRYDCLYVHTLTFPTPAVLTALFVRRKVRPVVHVHGNDLLSEVFLKKTLRRMASPIIRRARYIIVPSNYFRTLFMSRYPSVPAERVIVSASGGVGENFFAERARMRGKIVTIGYVSRIDEGKGWDTYLKAFAILKEKGIEVRGIMAGTGVQTAEMLAMKCRLGLDGVVDYRGAVAPDKLPAMYGEMDLFAFPTRSDESLGLVGLEALAGGVPVIASDIGGPAEYVIDGANGEKTVPGSAESLAESIEKMMGMTGEEYSAMSGRAIESVRPYLSGNVMAGLWGILSSEQ
ncbi:MAG: glycosyltransferase family 4 protein [Muribaculaceae bacterium]|nr:glycosyltransferase family 4 protein [Muribaculaceae bacterium]